MELHETPTNHVPEEWTVDGFLDEFIDIEKNDETISFCFLIGAGASISSKIPAA